MKQQHFLRAPVIYILLVLLFAPVLFLKIYFGPFYAFNGELIVELCLNNLPVEPGRL